MTCLSRPQVVNAPHDEYWSMQNRGAALMDLENVSNDGVAANGKHSC